VRLSPRAYPFSSTTKTIYVYALPVAAIAFRRLGLRLILLRPHDWSMRPSLDSRPAGALTPDTIRAVGLENVAWAGAWPLGHPDYRTGVSRSERLRKALYRCGEVIQPRDSVGGANCQ